MRALKVPYSTVLTLTRWPDAQLAHLPLASQQDDLDLLQGFMFKLIVRPSGLKAAWSGRARKQAPSEQCSTSSDRTHRLQGGMG